MPLVAAIDWVVQEGMLPCHVAETITQKFGENKDTRFTIKMPGPEGVEEMKVCHVAQHNRRQFASATMCRVEILHVGAASSVESTPPLSLRDSVRMIMPFDMKHTYA